MSKLYPELLTTAMHLIHLRSGKIEEAHDSLKDIEKYSGKLPSLISTLEVRLV
ncbi:hypothetical protein [Rufibacter sp. XAAS-G3-1]|uniref:hypothetical protein n=1 Tax=Rufibacter sp. XAAS-G3-1 TaxID=2729134 RepID=UPI0015E68322|nr:hypothetical protein [Rufibacter sp. XAAS-G3-1]